MELMGAIRERRSIRHFKCVPVAKETVDSILAAAKAAPSAGNLQARDFFVVTDHAVVKRLGRAAPNQSFIAEAPIAIVVCANTDAIAGYGRRGIELYCLQDTAAAIQNMLLVIHAVGLGSCWIGAFDESAVSAILALPKNLRPVAILPIGECAETPRPKKQRDDDVHFVRDSDQTELNGQRTSNKADARDDL